MMLDFLENIRAEQCTRGPDGHWLCSECGAVPLGETALLCDDCHAKAEAEREKVEQERQRREWIEAVYRTANRAISALPEWPHIRTAESFSAVVGSPALRSVAERWQPHRGSLLILGPSGVGKTSAIARAIVRLRGERLSARLESPRDGTARGALVELSALEWVTAAELGRAWSQHRLGAGEEPELIRRSVEAPILLIDELGPEPARVAGELFDLVDRRHTAQRPTVCTSGLSEQAFRLRYGDALTRRLTEKGLGLMVDTHPKTEVR